MSINDFEMRCKNTTTIWECESPNPPSISVLTEIASPFDSGRLTRSADFVFVYANPPVVRLTHPKAGFPVPIDRMCKSATKGMLLREFIACHRRGGRGAH